MKKKILLAFAAVACFGLLLACETDSKPSEYTVTFDLNGGSVIPNVSGADLNGSPTKKVAKGKDVGALPTPTSTSNHNFLGWNTAANGEGDSFTAASRVNGNMTVYARWQFVNAATEWTVTFDYNGGTKGTPGPDSIKIKNNQAGDSGTGVNQWPGIPTHTTDAFAGWFKSDGTGNEYTDTTPITGNLDLKAKWAAPVTVTFDLAGGKIDGAETYGPITIGTGGTLGTQLITPTRDNYAFVGWYSGDTKYEANTPINAAVTMTAKWEITYIVNFNVNTPAHAPGTVTPAKIEFKGAETEGASIATLPTPTYATGWDVGMSFEGWYPNPTETAGEQKVADGVAVTGSVTYFARWKFTAGVPTVEGETWVHDAPLLVTSEGDGYQGTWNSNNTINVDNSLTLAAEGANNYNGGAIRYLFPDGADDYDYVTLDYVYTGTLTIQPKQGTTNAAYLSGENGAGSQYPTLSSPGSFTYRNYNPGAANRGIAFQRAEGEGTVKFNKVTFYKGDWFNVTFDLDCDDAGPTPEPTNARPNPNMNIYLPTPTRPGYVLDGWYDGATKVMSLTSLTKNTVLKAKWIDENEVEKETVEMIVGGVTSPLPVYRFTMPENTTWSDLTAITFKIRVDDPATYGTTGRINVLGNFAATHFNANGANNVVGDWGVLWRMIGYTGSNVAIDGILNHNGGTPAESRMGVWVEYTFDVTPDRSYKNNYDGTNYPAAAATGPFFLGVGLATQSTRVEYYIKDIALIKTDGTTLIPHDPLTDTQGDTPLGDFYWASATNGTLTRSTAEIVKNMDVEFIPMP
jgi:uncharacterized repeat protein (TIGR02543 family)